MTALRRLLRQPLLLLLLLLGLILTLAANALNGQAGFTVGSDAEGWYTPDGFYGVESSPSGPFRWARPYTQLRLPHAGPGPLTLRLTLLDAAPTPRALWITLDGQEIYRGTTQPGGAPWVVTVLAPTTTDTPLLGIASDAWTPPGDSRTLGVGVQAVAVDAPQAGALAGLRVALLVVAVLVLVYTAVRATGQATVPLVIGLAVVALMGTLLAYGDPWLGAAVPFALVGSLAVTAIVARSQGGGGGAWGWGVLALAAGLALLTWGRFTTGDAEAMYQVTAGLAEDGRPWAHADHAWVKFGLGQPLLNVLLYWLGRAWATATGGDTGGLTRFCVALLNSGIVALTAGLLGVAAGRRWGVGVGWALAGTWLLATPALTYARLAFAEPLSGLLILGAFLGGGGWGLGARDGNAPEPRSTLRGVGLAGLCLGLAVLVKPANAIYIPLPALYLLWRVLTSSSSTETTQHPTHNTFHVSRFTFHALATFVLGLAPGLLATAGYNTLRYGSPLVFGYEREGFTTPLAVGLYGLIASPGKGLIWFAPPVVLGVFALARMLRGRVPGERALALLIGGQVAVVLLFHALWSSWEGNIAWGPRLILPVVPLLLWPLGTLAGRTGARRAWWVLGAAGLLVGVPGVLIEHYYYFQQMGVTTGGTTTEQLMLFSPAWSQIVAHWHYLLAGTHAALARPLLADWGLTPGWDTTVPGALTMLVLVGIVGILCAGKQALAPE